MRYGRTVAGAFIERINRFIAHVDVDGELQVCHVRNTGRLRELLLPGAKVLLLPSENPARKTAFSLVSVYKGSRLVNIDSMAPNRLFGEYMAEGKPWEGIGSIRPESKWGTSRFDFFIGVGDERKYVEVKGVTLERDGVAMFPDAPTLRGVKHVEELMGCMAEGYGAAVVFVIQMDGVRLFRPNDETHPAFGAALRRARQKGVDILAFDCDVKPGELHINKPIPVEL